MRLWMGSVTLSHVLAAKPVTTYLLQFTRVLIIFFFNDTATTEIYTLSLHDALPILNVLPPSIDLRRAVLSTYTPSEFPGSDRKSTRLNSSHSQISYAVFCLKKKKRQENVPLSDDLAARPEHTMLLHIMRSPLTMIGV